MHHYNPFGSGGSVTSGIARPTSSDDELETLTPRHVGGSSNGQRLGLSGILGAHGGDDEEEEEEDDGQHTLYSQLDDDEDGDGAAF